MSKKPLVSIIIPVFNVEKYVSQCVKSIQNQTYINLEIILINDGSTDCSEDICKKYAQDDKRIVLLNQKNGGQSKARNKGLDFCHGEYILFVDADDYISKFIGEDTISFAIRENLDIVEYGHKNVNTNTKAEFVGERSSNYEKLTHDEALIRVLDYKALMVPWNRLYKRYLFDDLRFPIGVIHEDEAILPYLIDKSKTYGLINNDYYAYVFRKGSTMNRDFDSKKLVIFKIMSDRRYYFNKKYNFKYDSIMLYHQYYRISKTLSMIQNKKLINNYKTEKKKLFKKIISSKKLDYKHKLKAMAYYYFPKVTFRA